MIRRFFSKSVTGTDGNSFDGASTRWMPLIDLGLFAMGILITVIPLQIVFFFHVIFVILSLGAFFWKFRGFLLRVAFWIPLTSLAILRDVQLGITQVDELIEIPLLTMILLMVYLIASRRAKTQHELEIQSDVLRKVKQELQSSAVTLEEQVASLNRVNQITTRRAAQLQTIAELSQSIAQVQNPNDLFPVAAQVISERFGFYHVGIFTLDHDREYAVLQAANSEGGRIMLERGHRLMLGTGVVGFAAQTGKPRIALDVGLDAVFFNNPDLPATRSEVALPLRTGERTIGVLDVQSTEQGAFTEEDLQVLNILANQVAVALENARLLSDARASAIQVQEVYNEFVRTEWSRTIKSVDQAGFRYNTGRIEMLESPMDGPDIESAVRTGKVMAVRENGPDARRSTATVPVKLRGEVIGVMRVESRDDSRHWREDELSLMEAVAERAALAMENARLFQDARRRAAKEKLISDATSRISGSLNIGNILEATASELERVLGGSEVVIRFGSRDSS